MPSDPVKDDSVFDVLYADVRRLSSLLSQFSDDGIVTELTRAAEESSSSQVGISVKVVKAEGTESGKTTSTRKINPQWMLPLLFLDHAKDRINRDISSAAIGSLVLISGRLIVTDLTFLKEMWKSPAMKRQILKGMTPTPEEPQGNRHDRRGNAKQPTKVDTSEQEALIELLQHLPHSVHMNIVTSELAAWSTIDLESLVGSVSDLVLKHGAKIAGHWSMVGILDGTPFVPHEDETDFDYDEILTPVEQVLIGMTGDNVWKVATELAMPIRQAFGRPISSYGVTPLVVFRELEV